MKTRRGKIFCRYFCFSSEAFKLCPVDNFLKVSGHLVWLIYGCVDNTNGLT